MHVAMAETLTAQDIEEQSIMLVNAGHEDRTTEDPREGRLPVCDSVSENEPHLQVQVLPQQSAQPMAIMNGTDQRSVYAPYEVCTKGPFTSGGLDGWTPKALSLFPLEVLTWWAFPQIG